MFIMPTHHHPRDILNQDKLSEVCNVKFQVWRKQDELFADDVQNTRSNGLYAVCPHRNKIHVAVRPANNNAFYVCINRFRTTFPSFLTGFFTHFHFILRLVSSERSSFSRFFFFPNSRDFRLLAHFPLSALSTHLHS